MKDERTPSIHVATVHMNAYNADWAAIQLDYLRRHLPEGFRLYGFFEKDPGAIGNSYYYFSTQPIVAHAVKLNLLADIIGFAAASDEDWLVFIDGDAFPVAPLVPFLREQLSRYPLVAVQRLENRGDPQPHPCFCATTVGFWKSIHGDWAKGPKWTNSEGRQVSDVGGVLWGKLRDEGISWGPILRSNRVNLHPLLFGLYGDVVYHHGSGFRQPLLRADSPHFDGKRVAGWYSRLVDRVFPPHVNKLWLHRVRLLLSPLERESRRVVKRNRAMSEAILDEIRSDSAFYVRFLEEKGGSQ